MFGRIRHLVVKEMVQTFRERRRLFFVFVGPVIQLFIFGYVAIMDVNNVPTALLDLDRSQESRELGRRLEASGYFTFAFHPTSPGDLGELLDRGKVLVAIQIDPGFEKYLKRQEPVAVQVLVDGTDSNSALIAMSYVNLIVARFSSDRAGPGAVTTSRVDFRTRVWYNPDLRSRNFFLPGVIALIVMLTCLMLTSMSIVRERELGTIEQLMVTPIRPFELVVGKTVPPAAVGFFDMLLVTVVGILWFNVPIKGALPFLFFCTGVYLLSILGIGLFISTISRTQQQAMMASFFFFQPAILLSGFATPIESMPLGLQYVTYLSPLRYFLVIVRGIFLKGVGLSVLWPQIVALLVLGAAIFVVSALRFKKRLS